MFKREEHALTYSLSGRHVAASAGKALAQMGLAESRLVPRGINARSLVGGRRYWTRIPHSNSLMFEYREWQSASKEHEQTWQSMTE